MDRELDVAPGGQSGEGAPGRQAWGSFVSLQSPLNSVMERTSLTLRESAVFYSLLLTASLLGHRFHYLPLPLPHFPSRNKMLKLKFDTNTGSVLDELDWVRESSIFL